MDISHKKKKKRSNGNSSFVHVFPKISLFPKKNHYSFKQAFKSILTVLSNGNHEPKSLTNIAIILGRFASREMRQTFSRLSKLEGKTNLIRLLFGHVLSKYF